MCAHDLCRVTLIMVMTALARLRGASFKVPTVGRVTRSFERTLRAVTLSGPRGELAHCALSAEVTEVRLQMRTYIISFSLLAGSTF